MSALTPTVTVPGADPGRLADVVAAARPAGRLTTAGQVALRTVRQFARTPQLLVVNTIQGAMFLLIFRYVFGGAIDTGAIPYVDFLVPGFVVTSVLFAGTGAASGVAQDVEWAVGPGPAGGRELWLLQARPETVWSRRPRQAVVPPGTSAMDRMLAYLGRPGAPGQAGPG